MLHLTPDCWVGLSYWRNLKYPRVWWGWRPVPLGVKVTGTARGPTQLEGNTQGECVGNWGHRGTGWGIGSDPQGTVMVVANVQSTLAEGTEQASRRRPGIRGDKEWELGEEDEDTYISGIRTPSKTAWYFLLLCTFSPFVFNVEPRYACYWSSLLLIHFNLNDTSVE